MGPAKEGLGRGTVGTIRLVTSFYSQVLGSPLLSKYFAGVPIEVLIAKQAAFIDTVARGEPGYTAIELQHLHSHLSIDDASFDELIRLLNNSLLEHEFGAEASKVVLSSFESFRHVIVNA
jgi:hemoglobin